MWRSWVRAFVFSLVALAGPVLAAGPCRVAALSYNIHAGIGIDGKHDIARIGEVIKAASPDVVSLQEVDRRTQRASGADLAAELARITGMEFAFGKAMDYGGGEYGNAVLVRGRIVKTQVHLIEPTPGHEPRVILDATVELPGCGSSVRLLATHFDHLSADDRMRGAKLANTLVHDSPLPSILSGDLNATQDKPEIRELAAEWKIAGEGKTLLTIPAAKPARQIDYVLFRPAPKWEVTDVRVIDEQVASDHRPILAVLRLSQ